MNTLIEIYIFVCVMLLLFDIVFLITKNLKNRRLHPKRYKMQNRLQSELEDYDPILGLSNNLKDFLKNEIEKTKNLIVLKNELKNTQIHKQEIQAEIRPYILNKIEVYQNKNDYEKAYYAYVVSSFDYENENGDKKFHSTFLSFLDSKSLYVFSNAMNAIYKFSDPYFMSVAIGKVSERRGFYHSKLLVDGLLEFKGDADKLHSLMIDEFYQYSDLTQESLLDYFRLKGADVEDFCLDILKERTVNEEVLYAAMRYFVKHPNEQAKIIFIDLIESSETSWVEQMLAIKALKHYSEPSVKHVVKEKITDKNWYVRINAINYLHNHTLRRDEIFDILSLNDQYTNETLLYFYKDNSEISKYIIDTIQMLNIEQNKIKENELPLDVALVGSGINLEM